MNDRFNIPLNIREKSNSIASFAGSVVVLVLLLLLLWQLDYHMITKPVKDAENAAIAEKQAEERKATTTYVYSADVIAVGDNLYHTGLLNSGMKEDGSWNYDHVYEHVVDEIQAADMAIVDQETVLTSDHDRISSYPCFATPTEVADSLMRAGFDVVESATNHFDDYGIELMEQTFDFWKNNYPDVPVLGVHETEEDAAKIKTKTVNDITFAFLDYTYGTNHFGVGEDFEYRIDLFDQVKIAAQLEEAKKISDVIIFIAHWGIEDETYPCEYEKQWATFLLQHGVDVLIGGHPHVLQPYGKMSDDAGNEMLIYYSLGNFVSCQNFLPELLGGMAKFTVRKTVLNDDVKIEILNQKIEPTVMHYNHDEGVYQVYMLRDYNDELGATHGANAYDGPAITMDNLRAQFEQTMNMNVKPSEKTYMLDAYYDWAGNMYNRHTKDEILDYDSMHSWEYYNSIGGY